MKLNQWLNTEILKHFSFRRDLLAALTVAIIVVPQGMAYAVLAGLPAIYGLYAAFIPLLVYPFFGSSRHLSVGPVALVSIILFSGLSTMATPGSPEFIQLALLTSLVAGLIQMILAIFRLGFLVNFLSEPVIHGFTSAAATIIILSQLKSVLGIDIDSSANILQLIQGLTENISSTHLLTLLIGAISVAFILILKRVRKKFPAGILVVVLGTLFTYLFQWNEFGVKIVGNVPAGFPEVTWAFIRLEDIVRIIPLAFVICLISFIESLAISKSIAVRHDNYPIDANKELMGLGIAKFVGSFFQAFPNTGSFSRSAVNDESGATSGMSSVFASIIIGFILLFFTPLFYYLPVPILGAIVIAAVVGLVNLGYGRKLFSIDRKDFYVYLTTFILTLLLGVQQGVFAGIVLSIIMIIQKTAKPHYAILGNLPGTRSFRNIKRYPNAKTRDDVLVMRYDQDIYFGNAEHFYDTINSAINHHPKVRTIILNSSAIGNVDSTGISKLCLLLKLLRSKEINLLFSHVRGPIRDKFSSTGMLDLIGKENIYLTINDALTSLDNQNERSALKQSYASQTSNRKK